MLRESGMPGDDLTVVRREPNIWRTTFPSELVMCEFGDGTQLRMLCKYGTGQTTSGYGHRSGTGYEAMVYRDVLQPLQASVPTFYGSWVNPESGDVWLAIEYLDGADRLHKVYTDTSTVIQQGAEWAGRFHRDAEAHLAASASSALTRYDADYYRGWADRTLGFAAAIGEDLPWLAPLCDRYREVIPELLHGRQTIVHGEFTVKNVLIQNATIVPIDWESAAIGAGEIDLASMVEGWSDDVRASCIAAYQRERWPEGAPGDFHLRFALAELYWSFRWLGDRPDGAKAHRTVWRFDRVRAIGEHMELVERNAS